MRSVLEARLLRAHTPFHFTKPFHSTKPSNGVACTGGSPNCQQCTSLGSITAVVWRVERCRLTEMKVLFTVWSYCWYEWLLLISVPRMRDRSIVVVQCCCIPIARKNLSWQICEILQRKEKGRWVIGGRNGPFFRDIRKYFSRLKLPCYIAKIQWWFITPTTSSRVVLLSWKFLEIFRKLFNTCCSCSKRAREVLPLAPDMFFCSSHALFSRFFFVSLLPKSKLIWLGQGPFQQANHSHSANNAHTGKSTAIISETKNPGRISWRSLEHSVWRNLNSRVGRITLEQIVL